MKVRTVRKHSNSHGAVFVKNPGRKYEAPDRDAQNLIRSGLIEEDKPDAPDGQD